jgi:FG-GAP repeat
MMIFRFCPTVSVSFTLLAAIASPLHGQVPGELGADDWSGIREAYLTARWCDGLTGENPVELDPKFTRKAFWLPSEASAVAASFVENAYLKPRNADAGDFFGTVALSGDTVVVGAPFADSNSITVNGDGKNNKVVNSGAVYVFVRKSGKWSQQAYLKASDGAAGDQFGFAVAISGNTVIVGAYAAGDSTTTPGTPATGTTPATPVTTTTKNLGAAYVFTRSAEKWTEQKILIPTAVKADVGDAFGYSVAVSGDTAVIGAIGESSKNGGVGGDAADNTQLQSGAAYVFFRSGTTWTQQAYLKAGKPGRGDLFGIAVAVAGDTVVVGAPNEASNATGVGGSQGNDLVTGSGAAYIFTRKSAIWVPQAYLKASNTGAGDQFGRAVGISGTTVIIGAPGEASSARQVNGNQGNNGAVKAGAAYVFAPTQLKWRQQAYLKSSKSSAGDLFGFSVAVSNDTAVVGAMGENGGGKSAGAAYVFTRSKSGWNSQSALRASRRGAGDRLGFSVSVSGETVVCGALGESSDARTINGDNSNNRAKNAGASYVFEGVRPIGPSISVQQPAGNELEAGTASVSFGKTILSAVVSKTFSIVNTGTTSLTGVAVIVTGTGLADFNLDTTATATTVLAGKSTNFIVKFQSIGIISGLRSATLKVVSNDRFNSPFEIGISGSAFSNTADKDGDGLNDWAEQEYSTLGFDWQVANPDKVAKLRAGANAAGLFTQSQLQALEISTPMLVKDPVTGEVTLTLSLQKSTDLTTFKPFSMSGATVNSTTGNVEFKFTPTETTEFYRVQGR